MGAPMNRKQRRAAEKKLGVSEKVRNTPLKPMLPLAPLDIEALCRKYPDIVPAVEKFEERCKVAASNDIFNLIFSCVLIALHDRHDFDSDRLNELVSDAVNHLDCCSSGFVTKEDLMGLVVELGVKVQDFDFDSVRHNAMQTNDRLKVYFEEVEAMNNMEKAYKLFDKGVTDSKTVAEKLGLKVSSVYKYKQLWNKSKIEDMKPEQFADKLFGEDEVKTADNSQVVRIVEEAIKVHSSEELEKEKIEEEVQIVEEVKVVETQKKVLDIPTKTRKFEVKRTVEIAAEFGTYSITGSVADVKLDTVEMGLTKADLLALAEELQAVAGEM